MDINRATASYTALTDPEKDQFKTLLSQHRVQMSLYTKQQNSVLEILDFINNTVGCSLRTHMQALSTLYDILKALKKRLAPTDRVRRLELARKYHALKKAPGTQALDMGLPQ
ncbi:hypothetical protein GJ744_003777 [Endocarpon pusillum]|uniref:Uncharacterized protein n=1 Tax=Endocarpon pusillum TaxID=364733 RepID=A0A8H7E5V8_9EURO|nr:hypothetical protein GJ744_003777 [Endocarpon pusillum]